MCHTQRNDERTLLRTYFNFLSHFPQSLLMSYGCIKSVLLKFTQLTMGIIH